VVLSGEPGIGKTALLTEALERCYEQGYMVFSGRAVELEKDLPFGVFADALERELMQRQAWRNLVTEDDLSLLASALPSIAPLLSRRAAPVRPDERHHLFLAIHKLIGMLAGEKPLALALDDLHWADPASVDLVCRLLHRPVANPLLLFLAFRPAESEPRLRTALNESERHARAAQVELSPLSAADAEKLLDDEIDRPLREAIYRESGGNPLYLEQLAVAAKLGGLASRFPEAESEGLGVPAPVAAAIRSELDRLSSTARSLIEGASLLGETFEPDFAATTAGLDDEGLRGLDELLDADLIRSADSPRSFHFRHPIIRHAVYEGTRASWRIAAHGRAAAALEAAGAPVSLRAPHIEKSARIGDEHAVATLRQAGQETASRAPASAARWFEAALQLLPEREGNLELRLGLLIQRATALGMAGHISESREALGDFLANAPQSNELRVEAAIFAAILDELLGSQEVGRKLLLEELSKIALDDGPEAADLMRELAFTSFVDADWKATSDWASKALHAECEGMVRVGALAAQGLAEMGLGETAQMRRTVADAANLFDGLSDADISQHHPGIGIWLGWAEVCTENFDDAIRHLKRAVDISRSIGQRHLTVGLLAAQGQAIALRGHGKELAALAETATEAALLSPSDLFLSWAMTLRCQVSLWAGDLHDAIRFGEQAVSAASASNSPQSDIARVQLASALLEIGEPERARELLVSGSGAPKPPPFPLFEALSYELLVRVEVAFGDLGRAGDLASKAEEIAQRLGLQVPLAQANRARALVLLKAGEAEQAATAAIASCEAAEKVHAEVEADRSRTLAGIALTATDQRDRAIVCLEAAHSRLIGFGAFRYGDEAAQQLRKLGRPVARVEVGKGDLGLTRREVEVMQLVVTGMTNRQIASELFLSVRTVDRHVSRIFEKLNVHSRAAASSVFERKRLSAHA
jgi:DNA-binding NarL/FixJ family response regulator